MAAKNLQTRESTIPAGNKRDLSEIHRVISRAGFEIEEKIVGVSWKSIFILSMVALGAFNYFLLKEMKTLKSDVANLESLSAKEVKIILDQKMSADGLRTSYFDNKLEAVREDLIKEIKNASNREQPMRLVKTEMESPAFHLHDNVSPFARLNKLNLQDYTVSNLRVYPKYHYFLAEQSRLRRNFMEETRSIVNDFVKSHQIIGADRKEYLRLLEAKDLVENQHRDAQNERNAHWRNVFRSYAKR